jgi:methylthioribose-1-phosphate isomerase
MKKNLEDIQTLRWVVDHLEMIDQRVLPQKFIYLKYKTARDVADGIKTMVVRGAPAIGCAAAFGIALEALHLAAKDDEDFNLDMQQAFEVLAASRPTAINLFWALKRMRAVWDASVHKSQSQIAQILLEEAQAISIEDIEINKAMGEFGQRLLADGARVLTHCNAGALATAGHGTALGIIRSAVAAGKKISVIADETRPFLQGSRLTAWEMVQEAIPTTLISDGMAGHLMATGCIDAVIVGTDRVSLNGDVANKIGTYMVAVLAHRHKIPFYVACPLSTIDINIESGLQIPIEERDPEEVLGFGGVRTAANGVMVRNPSFDVTPADLVTALITEKGVIENPTKEKILDLFRVNGLTK